MNGSRSQVHRGGGGLFIPWQNEADHIVWNFKRMYVCMYECIDVCMHVQMDGWMHAWI